MIKNNQIWSDNIIRKFDPSFIHRWEAYNDLLCSCISKRTLWVDVGCGNNSVVEDYGEKCRFAVGVDINVPQIVITQPFICADLRCLPFRSESVDLITLRFVVEHLRNIPDDLKEIERVIRPNGCVVILTTNSCSPFISMLRFLPFSMKRELIRILFKVEEADILPTFHKFNSIKEMKRGIYNLKLVHIDFIQDANYTRKFLFLIFFFWHLITRQPFLKTLRTNILAVFNKSEKTL